MDSEIEPVRIVSGKKVLEACKSPRSNVLLHGIKAKQVLVSLLTIMCGLYLLLRNPILESGRWRPTLQVDLVEIAVSKGASENVVLETDEDASKDETAGQNLMQNGTPALVLQQYNNNSCEFTRGNWVEDSSRPLYSGKACRRWLSDMWACRLGSRQDFSYENYRWQPHGCDLPAFDSVQFLHRMRDKTIAFIGDSLGRQQYQSLMCMLTGTMQKLKVVDASSVYKFAKPQRNARPSGWAQTFLLTNTTVLFYWSATLCDIEPLQRNGNSAMHMDRVPAFLRDYIHKLDVLVLNTGHHWNRGKIKLNRWVFHVNGKPSQQSKLTVHAARRLAVLNAIHWLDEQAKMRPSLQVFMRTLSPRHFVGGDWNSGGRCDNIEALSSDALKDFRGDTDVEHAVRGTKVRLLDISYLSKSRGEAHISKYFSKGPRQDCLHWCLPGVPDTWNELLYGYLIDNRTDNKADILLAKQDQSTSEEVIIFEVGSD